MRTMRGIFGFTLILMVFVFAAACAGPNRAECKKACVKFKTCDEQTKIENSIYNDTFVDNCQRSCDAADEIDEGLAKCIVRAECLKLMECHSGG